MAGISLPRGGGLVGNDVYIERESSGCIMVKTAKSTEASQKDDIFMGGIGGACRLDGIFHILPSASQKK